LNSQFLSDGNSELSIDQIFGLLDSSNFTNFFLPTFLQPAVEPIPEHIKHKLSRASERVGDGCTYPNVGANVMPLIQRDLDLRQQIPIRSCIGYQITVHEKFEHRGPDAAESSILCERFPNRGTEEHGLRRLFSIHWQVRAGLELDEAKASQALAE